MRRDSGAMTHLQFVRHVERHVARDQAYAWLIVGILLGPLVLGLSCMAGIGL